MPDRYVTLGTSIVSGITTDMILSKENPGFLVRWIAWDSDFRRDLQIGDRILQINKENMAPLLKNGASTGIGLYGEAQHWKDINAKDGQEITLSVLRQGKVVSVKGKLHAECIYMDGKGNRAIAPGGPTLMERDGFSDAWSSWIEKYLQKVALLFLKGWEQTSFDNRRELGKMLEEKPRIDLLLQKYTGKLSQVMADDYNRLIKSLEGELVKLSDKDMEYREIGERRVKQAKEAAKKAWEAVRKKYSDETIDPFPATDILDKADVVGKVVELPRITYKNIINDMGKAYAFVGSDSDGYYFLLLDEKEGHDFVEVMYRYKGQINPRMPEQFRYLGRIQDDPRMYTVNREPVTGLTIKLLAVLAGDDELFVDLSEKKTVYAGEKELAQIPMAKHDTSTPAATIQTMIQAIKVGNDKVWRELIAPWKVMEGIDGINKLDITFRPSLAALESEWSNSRNLITSKVYDARVVRVEPTTVAIPKNAKEGIPLVEEATVYVEHVGRIDISKTQFEYRVFTNMNVKRCWTVQRIDGGPWLITSMQHL